MAFVSTGSNGGMGFGRGSGWYDAGRVVFGRRDEDAVVCEGKEEGGGVILRGEGVG